MCMWCACGVRVRCVCVYACVCHARTRAISFLHLSSFQTAAGNLRENKKALSVVSAPTSPHLLHNARLVQRLEDLDEKHFDLVSLFLRAEVLLDLLAVPCVRVCVR